MGGLSLRLNPTLFILMYGPCLVCWTQKVSLIVWFLGVCLSIFWLLLLPLLFTFSVLGLFLRWFLTLALALSFVFYFSFSWRWQLKTLGELQVIVLDFIHYAGKGYDLLLIGGHGVPLVVLPQNFKLVQGGGHYLARWYVLAVVVLISLGLGVSQKFYVGCQLVCLEEVYH